jgi:purine-binding chemotaxis protein CheW
MVQQREEDQKALNEIQLVIFCLGREEFGMDIAQVKEIIRMQNVTPMPRSPQFIEGIINLRGQIIAVMDMAQRFGMESSKRTDKARIVVVEVQGNTVGVVVDEVPEVLRISLDDIAEAPEMIETQVHADFIKGVGKLENRLIVLLNADKILSQEESKELVQATQE